MASNVAQICKIIRLTTSDQDNEAIAALRSVQRLLAKDGLDLATVVEAGLISRPAAPINEAFAGFWNLSPKAAGHTTPRATPHAKQSIVVDVVDLPLGSFNASLKIIEERKIQAGGVMLVVEVCYDGIDIIRRFPTMCAFGAQAAKIKAIIAELGDQNSATLRVQPPSHPGHLTRITSIQL